MCASAYPVGVSVLVERLEEALLGEAGDLAEFLEQSALGFGCLSN